MKREKITYAIYHLTEKHTAFNLGKMRVRVSFMGGIVTKKGVTPATFSTSDPIVQMAIQNSADFKSGAISIVSRYPMAGEVKIGRNEIKPKVSDGTDGGAEAPAPGQSAAAGMTGISGEGEAPAPVDDDADGIEVKDGTDIPESGVMDEAGHEDEAAADTETVVDSKSAEKMLTPMEFDNNDDARDFLEAQFGLVRSKLRVRADIVAAGEAHGIAISFT